MKKLAGLAVAALVILPTMPAHADVVRCTPKVGTPAFASGAVGTNRPAMKLPLCVKAVYTAPSVSDGHHRSVSPVHTVAVHTVAVKHPRVVAVSGPLVR